MYMHFEGGWQQREKKKEGAGGIYKKKKKITGKKVYQKVKFYFSLNPLRLVPCGVWAKEEEQKGKIS